jgi:GAF domain-containing protein
VCDLSGIRQQGSRTPIAKPGVTMTLEDPFVRVLLAFVTSMSRSYDLTDMCYELCERTTEVLGVTGAGVAVADGGGRLSFVTATNERIVQIELVQEQNQEGPCVTAFEHQRVVVLEDIQSVEQWPYYKAAANQLHLRSVMGFPLSFDKKRLGAFNVYHHDPRKWTDEEIRIASSMAEMATAYLTRATELQQVREVNDQLQKALDSRVIIEQAKGLLAGERGVDVDKAFEILRAHARNNSILLKDVATAVVRMGLRIPDKSVPDSPA